MGHYFLALTMAVLVSSIQAYRTYMKYIPNAGYVISPIDNAVHPGVGHILNNGTGDRNCFGKDFISVNKKWSELCVMDSDGDGLLNGKELGDPKCEWTTGKAIAHDYISDPGVCTPISSKRCQTMNAQSSTCPFSLKPTKPRVKSSISTTPKTRGSTGHYTTFSGLFYATVFLVSAMF